MTLLDLRILSSFFECTIFEEGKGRVVLLIVSKKEVKLYHIYTDTDL
jgi:hypothetical protein